MEDLPQHVQDSIASFDVAITNIEKVLNPFFAKDFKQLESQLAPSDGAKLNIAMAYAAYTLFYMFLRTQGISPTDHPVTLELDRVKQYLQKIRNITEKQAPKIRVNVEASRRVISAGVYQPKDQQSKDQQSKNQQSKDQQSKNQQSKDQQSKDQPKDQQSKDQQSKDQQSKNQQSKDQQSKDQPSKDQPKGQPPKYIPPKFQQSKDQPPKTQHTRYQQLNKKRKSDSEEEPPAKRARTPQGNEKGTEEIEIKDEVVEPMRRAPDWKDKTEKRSGSKKSKK
jgi:hypothetical protein